MPAGTVEREVSPSRLFWVPLSLNLLLGFVTWKLMVAPMVWTSDMNRWLVVIGATETMTLLVGAWMVASRRPRQLGAAVIGAAVVSSLGNGVGFAIGVLSGMS